MGIGLRQVSAGPQLLGTISGQVPIWNNATNLWEVSSSVMAPAVSPAGYTVSDINSALASGAAEICFPPGDYIIDAPVTQSTGNQTLTFQTGAALVFSSNGLGRFVVGGAGAVIAGTPAVRFDAASAVAYVALDIHGQGASCRSVRFAVNANVSNVTLLRLSGDYAAVQDVTIEGVGEFGKGVELANQDGSEVKWCETGVIRWFPVDDGSTSRHYGSLLRLRCQNSICNGIYCNTGGRTFIDQVVDNDGHCNQLRNPQIYSLKASWGVRIRDNAEFLEIFGGMLHQSSDGVGALTGSQGIEVGEGSLKVYGTLVIGWDIGVRFTGSCDSCDFVGAVVANNKSWQVEIDSGSWPVSACGFHGFYSETEAVPGSNFHFKTGQALGMTFSAAQFSYNDVAILVEPGFGGGNIDLLGCRFQATSVTDAVTQPNQYTTFWFGNNAFFGSNNLSKGAFASNAQDILNPSVTTLAVATSLKIGSAATAADAIRAHLSTFFTANFASGIGAGTAVELEFNWTGVLVNDQLLWSVNQTLATNTSLLFLAYISSTNHVRLRAYNPTGVAVGAISGGFSVSIFRHSPQ